MKVADWTALGALIVSVIALIVALWNRRADIARLQKHREEDAAREKAEAHRERVWAILDREPGIRTVNALEKNDGAAGRRIELLRRTVEQLKALGEEELAGGLAAVLRQDWGADTDDDSFDARDTFISSAVKFMKG